jgi:hypothetical protein
MLTLGKRAIVIENARCVRTAGQHQSKPASMVWAWLVPVSSACHETGLLGLSVAWAQLMQRIPSTNLRAFLGVLLLQCRTRYVHIAMYSFTDRQPLPTNHQTIVANLSFRGEDSRAVFMGKLRGIGMSVSMALSRLDIQGRV